MSYSAFTIQSSAGKIREIITSVKAASAAELQRIFGGDTKTIPISALWDTGASSSCISKKVAAEIGLQPLGMAEVHTAGGIHTVPVYKIDVFLNDIIFYSIEVTEFVGNGKFDMLVGMDIITLGDLAITNANGNTAVSFRIPPDAFHIDYVKALQKNKSGKLVKEQLRKKQF